MQLYCIRGWLGKSCSTSCCSARHGILRITPWIVKCSQCNKGVCLISDVSCKKHGGPKCSEGTLLKTCSMYTKWCTKWQNVPQKRNVENSAASNMNAGVFLVAKNVILQNATGEYGESSGSLAPMFIYSIFHTTISDILDSVTYVSPKLNWQASF